MTRKDERDLIIGVAAFLFLTFGSVPAIYYYARWVCYWMPDWAVCQ